MNPIKSILSLSLIALTLSACCKTDIAIEQSNTFIESQKLDKTIPNWKTKLAQPEQLSFSDDKSYFWQLKTTQGDINIVLFHETAPMHVSSTIYLTRIGFYDGLTFHRVIPGFMAQGGDPLGNGRGNPGYKYAGEFEGTASHDRPGVLSMANSGPNTDGSQFFITFNATPHLDNRHTIFGEVIDGIDDTLPAIEKLGQRSGKTQEEVKIISALIVVKDKVAVENKVDE